MTSPFGLSSSVAVHIFKAAGMSAVTVAEVPLLVVTVTSMVPAEPAGAVATTSFAAARAVATGDALRRLATEIAVIGGAEIYAQWMDSADRLEITEVHARPEGDTYLATIDAGVWEEVARVRNSAGSDDSADFSYVTYRRRKSH